jgi:diguanylate cyclase (GGDEF)-like protein
MWIYQNQLSILNESECDRLTGLLNRKTFDDKIAKILLANRDSSDRKMPVEHRRMLRPKKGTNWLAMLDIDHFKRINDTFGHLYGDEVLLLLSRLMKKSFRNADLLFRYGGEEFIVVLPSLEVQDVWVTLERFRKAVESFPFPQVGKVTVSIGFVDMGSQYVPATVVGHADQALYYAKRNGRNRICSYEDLIAAGELSGGMASTDVELF